MAIRYAVAAGSIDDPTRWDGGVLPDPGDDVYLNNFAMTASSGADISWASLRSTSNVTPAISAGGSLTIGAARNFVFTDMFMRTDAVANTLITITASSGTVSITGSARNGTPTGTSSFCINRTGNCNFVFNGSILPQVGATAAVMQFTGTGSVTIGSSGSPVTFGLAVSAGIIVNNASIVFQMWADQFAGNLGNALTLTLVSTAYTNGPVYGGSASSRYGITSASTLGTHTHDGDVYAGTAGSTPGGIAKSGASTLIVNGNVISNTTYSISNALTHIGGTLIFNGDVVVGPSTPLSVTGGGGPFTLNIGSITRSTQANVTGISVGLAATGNITVTNPIAGGTGGTSASAITLGGTANKQLTVPSITGGGAANVPGVLVTATSGIVTINANCIGANFSGANGVNVTGVASTTIINGKVTGNNYGVGTAVPGPAAGVAVTVLANVSVREIESGERGQSGIVGPVFMLSNPANKSTFRQTIGGLTTELVPASSSSYNSAYGYII